MAPLKHSTTWHLKVRCYMAPLKPVATWHPKVCCYTTPLKSIATQQYFYKITNYLQKSKYYFGNFYKKNSILFCNFYKKDQYYFGNFYKEPNTIWQLFTKSPILFWQLFTKAQYYFDNYLQKPNTILATLFWNLLKKRKKKKENPKLLGKKLFYQSPNAIWKKNYIMLKTQNYSLEKSYFDILIPQTHRKYKFLMTYYPYFKTISFTKFMLTILIFSIRNSNYNSPCI